MKIVTLLVETYVDDEGKHTCASDFEQGHVCRFFGATNFGAVELCCVNVEQVEIHRNKDGFGWLQPHDNCPLKELV